MCRANRDSSARACSIINTQSIKVISFKLSMSKRKTIQKSVIPDWRRVSLDFLERSLIKLVLCIIIHLWDSYLSLNQIFLKRIILEPLFGGYWIDLFFQFVISKGLIVLAIYAAYYINLQFCLGCYEGNYVGFPMSSCTPPFVFLFEVFFLEDICFFS